MKKRLWIAVVIGILLLLLGFYLSLQIGAKDITFTEILQTFTTSRDTISSQIIKDVRLPRTFAAIITGGLLAVSGTMVQGVFKNPVAEPSILGITQGAVMFVAMASFLPFLSSRFLLAIAGAAISGTIIFLFSLKKQIRQSISMLLLAGCAMSMFFLSIASIIALLQNRSQELAFWIAGGFRQIEWLHVFWLFAITIITFCFLPFFAHKINLLSLGDDTAIGLGILPEKVRQHILLLLIPICGICVACAGNIGFVGLCIPHILRKWIGSDYRILLPLSFLYGGILLVFSDLLAKTLAVPYELPVGIFTALLGIPIFILQIRKELT